VPWVAKQIAILRNLDEQEVGMQTSANFDRLFQGVLS
jgi:Tat protein secretion system quality control protein TatD with DNase activity